MRESTFTTLLNLIAGFVINYFWLIVFLIVVIVILRQIYIVHGDKIHRLFDKYLNN